MGVASAFLAIFYGLLCLAVGMCGRYRRGGFFLTLLLAFVLTPPVTLVALYLFAPRIPAPPQPR
jgi:hypothetical protein